jgi:OmpA-OmpF porin, OOP family
MILKSKTLKVANLLFLGLISFSSISQEEQERNLVPNGSFETLEGKLKALGCIENASGWYSPTGVRADIFTSAKKTPDIDVPVNKFGKEEPKDGITYAGILAFSYGNKEPRSYMYAKLETPLKKGQKYCVKFYVSLAETSKYSCNQLGVHFSSKPLGTDQKVSIIEKTHVLQAENKVFNAMYNWDEVCSEYTAEGGEKFITIGNFTSDADTKNEKNKKTKEYSDQLIQAYYYIDDVSVKLVSQEEICFCQEKKKEAEVYSTLIYQKIANINDEMSTKEKIEAQKLYFGAGSSSLSLEAKKALDLIVSEMKANTALKLEVKGHNDTMESKLAPEAEMYKEISNKRINEVFMYLQEMGIAESRLISTSEGSMYENSEIIETDDEELKLAKNRRVSFKVR